MRSWVSAGPDGGVADGEEAAEGDGGVGVLQGGEGGKMRDEDGFPEMVGGH